MIAVCSYLYFAGGRSDQWYFCGVSDALAAGAVCHAEAFLPQRGTVEEEGFTIREPWRGDVNSAVFYFGRHWLLAFVHSSATLRQKGRTKAPKDLRICTRKGHFREMNLLTAVCFFLQSATILSCLAYIFLFVGSVAFQKESSCSLPANECITLGMIEEHVHTPVKTSGCLY